MVEILPREKERIAELRGRLEEHYDLRYVSGEYSLPSMASVLMPYWNKLNVNPDQQLKDLERVAPMEAFLFPFEHSVNPADAAKYAVPRIGEVYNLGPEEAVEFLLGNKLDKVKYLWGNLSRRQTPEGYAREEVQLILTGEKTYVFAETVPMLRSKGKSKLEEILGEFDIGTSLKF